MRLALLALLRYNKDAESILQYLLAYVNNQSCVYGSVELQVREKSFRTTHKTIASRMFEPDSKKEKSDGTISTN
jgi:hypothetical protein